MAEAYYYASAILQSNVFFLFKFYHWMRNDFYKSKKKKVSLQDERASFNPSCCTVFIGAVSLAR